MKSLNLLSTTLKINALFSLVSGVLLIALHQYWQQIFGISFPFHATGAGILLFAWYVFKIARQTPVVIKAAKSVIIMDLSWVLMSIVVLFVNESISAAGNWLIGITAILVADFAIFQYLGIKNLLKAGNSV